MPPPFYFTALDLHSNIDVPRYVVLEHPVGDDQHGEQHKDVERQASRFSTESESVVDGQSPIAIESKLREKFSTEHAPFRSSYSNGATAEHSRQRTNKLF